MDKYFPTPIQEFQYYDKYARYNYDLGRRETWEETVDRAVDYLYSLATDRVPAEYYEEIKDYMLNMKSMPSMRLLATAGKAAQRNSISIYNCSYLPVKDIQAFGEALMISMSGCGVGYSVEEKYTSQIPSVKMQCNKQLRLTVEDSTEGWQYIVQYAIDGWIMGYDVSIDYSQLRPAGAPLKIKGGYASGPEPLKHALEKIRAIILNRQGSNLRPIDCHDIMCLVGNAAVSGGVRRTAMIALFDQSDKEMLECKNGEFYIDNPQRWNANNSIIIDSSISRNSFDSIFNQMIEGDRGEPGIFNRESAISLAPIRRNKSKLIECGTNPCGEIVLRPYEFCNLSIAVARDGDTFEDLRGKVRIATMIGSIQSLATNFVGLREDWKINSEEERLLGVDITGHMDCPTVQDPTVQFGLQACALQEARKMSDLLGINMPASITTVKPAGNSSVLLDVSSGIHARWAKYYVRNVRVSLHSPLYSVLRYNDVPMVPENGQTEDNATTWVVSFPVKSPDNSKVRSERSALEQCEYWKTCKLNWTEHNPSVTITYKREEVQELADWVFDNLEIVGGMTFLPSFDAKYDLLPYVEINEEEYNERKGKFPNIDFSVIKLFEDTDQTTASQEVACFAGNCETEY
jgi:ribonucleoside-diphosphate reductase alpha chain